MIQPAFAADKVSLFKVITAKDEIVIGITEDELAQMEGRNAGGIARTSVAKGSMSVWRYAVHKSATGDLEQAPLHKIGLIANDSLRVEPLCDAAEGVADRRDEEDAFPFSPCGRRCPRDKRGRMRGLYPRRPDPSSVSLPLRVKRSTLLPQGEKASAHSHGFPADRPRTCGPEYALFRAAGAFWVAPGAFRGSAP